MLKARQGLRVRRRFVGVRDSGNLRLQWQVFYARFGKVDLARPSTPKEGSQ
jgi:hypothetical protein